MVRLDAGREARRDLAILDAIAAKESGDPAVYSRALVELVDLDRRLKLEQRAELSDLPATVEGCVVVLNLAARILEEMAA